MFLNLQLPLKIWNQNYYNLKFFIFNLIYKTLQIKKQPLMYNEKLNSSTVHLKQTSLMIPIFQHCSKAIANLSLQTSFQENQQIDQYKPFQLYNSNKNSSNSSKYIVIDSTHQLPQSLFECKYLCPVFRADNKKSYICIKGDNLWDFYRMKKSKQIILPEQELWIMLKNISQALQTLHEHGFYHQHLKQYSIYRKNQHYYQLVFHPSIKSMQQLASNSKFYWHDFYLSPQQLKIKPSSSLQSNQIVKIQKYSAQIFALGMIILNVMNPFDFNRNIYSKKQYAVDYNVVKDKLRYAKLNYSKDLTDLVQNCLKQYVEQRYTLAQLRNHIATYLDKHLDKMSHFNRIAASLIKSKASSSKSSPNKKSNSQNKFTNDNKSVISQNLQKVSKQKAINQSPQSLKIKSNKIQKHQENKFYSPPPAKWKKQYPADTVQRKKQLQINENQQKVSKNNYQKVQQQVIQNKKQILNNSKQKKIKEQESQLKQKKTFQIGKKYLQNKNLISIKEQKENSMVISLKSSRNSNGSQKIQKQFSFQRGTFGFQLQPQSPQFKTMFQNPKTQSKKSQLESNSKKQNKNESSQNLKKQKQKMQVQKNTIHQDYVSEQKFQQNKISTFYQKLEEIDKKLNQIIIELDIDICLLGIEKLQENIGYQGVWIQGDLFFGNFKSGRRNGLGLQIFSEGQYYYGFFKDDLFHGEGFYFWNQHQYFHGIFQNGLKKIGTLFGPKIKYFGQFASNKFNGFGKATNPDGQVYIGQWINGKKQGIGEVIHITQDKFIGQWKKGKKYGTGVFIANDFMIKGYWKRHQIVGNCLIQYKTGYIYEGGLKIQQDQFYRHGYGVYKFPKGGYFKGTFHNNQATHGQILYKNGQKYIGTLKQMKRHGFGEYHYLNGTIYKGRWINDAKVQVQKQEKIIQKQQKEF